jgi:hypothetical protein
MAEYTRGSESVFDCKNILRIQSIVAMNVLEMMGGGKGRTLARESGKAKTREDPWPGPR